MWVVLVLYTIGWIVVLGLSIGAIIGTVGLVAGRQAAGLETPKLLWATHFSIFIVAPFCTMIAWVAAWQGEWTLAYVFINLPLTVLVTFFVLLFQIRD